MQAAAPAQVRPASHGQRGAIAAAHPLAVEVGERILRDGGSAADAAIAAQAMLCVLMPDACGLGGDMLALVRNAQGAVIAVQGTGASPAGYSHYADDGAGSVTVPGIVDAWCELSRMAGRFPLARVLEPARRLASEGMRVSPTLSAALLRHRGRLLQGGAENWSLFGAAAGAVVMQPQLAALLASIGAQGRGAFYGDAAAAAIAASVARRGGSLSIADMSAHATPLAVPIEVGWGDWRVLVQPPITQGVLLAMAVQAWERHGDIATGLHDHAGVELTQAAFACRDDVAQGARLLELQLALDLRCASRRGGPRAYLHTAGVAAVDDSGQLISSLVSVFDDFGSCVYVPELGITLNNRAAGFTAGANAPGPGRRPVHTLAPAMLVTPQSSVALATPGADGQVQTLLQVLAAMRLEGADLASAIARPRWRSENGRLLIEQSHPGMQRLQALGHDLLVVEDGDVRLGAVVAAVLTRDGVAAAADWRRETCCGAVQ